MLRALIVVSAFAGCGRIGYELRDHPATDASAADGALSDDANTAGLCPGDTTQLGGPGVVQAVVCIELAERGTMTWTDAKATCGELGRRLCLDIEWATACANATGLVDMADDAVSEWEWVAEEAGGVAQKRGFGACADTAAHEIFVDSYDYRCCLDV